MPRQIPPIYSLEDVDPRFNYELRRKLNDAINLSDERQEQRNRRLASGASVIGAGISLFPHPAAKAIGTLLQLPDIYYDTKDAINNPSSKTNWGHLTLDGFNLIPGLTNIMSDDLLKIPGIIDDTYSATTGRDAIQDVRRSLSTSDNKRSIKDKRNNRK